MGRTQDGGRRKQKTILKVHTVCSLYGCEEGGTMVVVEMGGNEVFGKTALLPGTSSWRSPCC